MSRKPQIVFIGGGMTFKTNGDYLRWLKNKKINLEGYKTWSKEDFDKRLGRRFEIIRPQMPCKENAKYKEWKIFFERFFPHLRNEVVLIGSSLGGIFLAKYLSENKFPKKIRGIFLVCPPFDDTSPVEDLAGGFKLKFNLARLDKASKNLYLMFSKDDEVVPPAHAEKYRKKLKNAQIFIYKGKKGHFRVPKLPEIVRLIKSLGRAV